MNGIDAVFSICWSALGSTASGGRKRIALSLSLNTASSFLRYRRSEHFLHCEAGAAAWKRVELVAAVGPDWMGHAAVRCEAGVVALLIPVVDRRAGENAAAIVLVRADVADAHIRREPR